MKDKNKKLVHSLLDLVLEKRDSEDVLEALRNA